MWPERLPGGHALLFTITPLSGGLDSAQVAVLDLQTGTRTLVWVDRQGRETPIPAPPRRYVYPRLSPDGTRVAVVTVEQEIDLIRRPEDA